MRKTGTGILARGARGATYSCGTAPASHRLPLVSVVCSIPSLDCSRWSVQRQCAIKKVSYAVMLRLLLIRHGQTLWNKELRYNGDTDTDLTPLGRRQAAAVAARLRT